MARSWKFRVYNAKQQPKLRAHPATRIFSATGGPSGSNSSATNTNVTDFAVTDSGSEDGSTTKSQ